MPKRIELRIGEVVSVSGIGVTLAYTKGKVAAIVASEFDDEGTADSSTSLLTAASMWRRRFDMKPQSGKDSGNSGSV